MYEIKFLVSVVTVTDGVLCLMKNMSLECLSCPQKQQPYKKPAGQRVSEHHQKSKSVLKPSHLDLREGVNLPPH
jgi:hypothetical protein